MGRSASCSLLRTLSGMASRKQAVDEPARRLGLASVKPLAIKPEAPARLVLDNVIIARRAALPVPPPFGGNAFGPLRMRDMVRLTPPAEVPRRPFRHQRGHFRLLRL